MTGPNLKMAAVFARTLKEKKGKQHNTFKIIRIRDSLFSINDIEKLATRSNRIMESRQKTRIPGFFHLPATEERYSLETG